MDIPTQLTTYQDKLKYLFRTKELLRLEHNARGKNFRDGKITEAEFRDYQLADFEPRLKNVLQEINKIKEVEGMFVGNGADLTAKQQESLALQETGKLDTKYDLDINLTEINGSPN